jgi:Rod binding domain-containing protein
MIPLPSATAGALSSEHAASDPEKLRKAAQGLEGLFLSQLLKIMRSTAGGDEQTGMAGKSIMGDYADLELGRVLAEKKGIGLTDLVCRSLAGRSPRGAEAQPVEGKPAGTSSYLPLQSDRHRTPVMLPLESSATRAGLSPARRASFYDLHVRRAARMFRLNPKLIHSMIAVESGGNAEALSPRSAKGLMQLTDSTAAQMGVEDVWDPAQNIAGGARYLRELLDRYDHDLHRALAAYNAGPGAVDRHRGVPPYPETQNYVRKVLDRYYGRAAGDHHGL